MKIGYYKCTAKARKPGQAVLAQHDNHIYLIHVLYNYDRDWPEGVLKQRCLLGNRFFSRAALPHEVGVVRGNKRAVSYRYRDIAGLVEDERRAGISEETIAAMVAAFPKGSAQPQRPANPVPPLEKEKVNFCSEQTGLQGPEVEPVLQGRGNQ